MNSQETRVIWSSTKVEKNLIVKKLKSHFVQEIKVILFTSSYCINCLVGICGGCNSNSNERAFFKKSLDGLDETQVSRHYHCLASNFRGLLQ